MKLTVLSENTSVFENLGSEHGLSLYIETKKHKLLFDTGASGLFAENAEKLGVKLSEVDTAVISHGHYDHGGGLKVFLDLNNRAKIYLHNKAFGEYYSLKSGGTRAYIGLDKSLLPCNRFILCGDSLILDDELELFSGVSPKRFFPSSNSNLYKKAGETLERDDFLHEQNLIIRQRGKNLLLAGCAHNGIVNIVDRFEADKGCFPNCVIGGFHLYSPGAKTSESPEIVDKIGKVLLDSRAQYYTCHCTGFEAYTRLKSIMGEEIGYLSAGAELTL